MNFAINKKKYLLIDVVPQKESKETIAQNLNEALDLIRSHRGGEVVKIIQKRDHPHPSTYVGSGKAIEIAEIVKQQQIDVIILNAIAKSTQLFNLKQMYWNINPNIEIWDRVDLILHIFAKHAQTAESQLQIKLASMRHMGPRVYGLSEELGRQMGGIGGRGVGETNVELMKRHFRDQIKSAKDQLIKLSTQRKIQLVRRRDKGLSTVSIVGYTNAGKTSLFNILTSKKKLAKDVLFATLDSVVGTLYLQDIGKKVIISDTIGFIRDLPPSLIDAFKSTLLESINADLLLHVIDCSDPMMLDKIYVVEKILEELGIANKPRIDVYNKADKLELSEIITLKKDKSAVISIKELAGIGHLIKLVQSSLFK